MFNSRMISDENRQLCEARTPQPIVERAAGSSNFVESSDGNLCCGEQLVARHGKVNANRRLYPLHVMHKAVASAKRKAAAGMLGGAVHHPKSRDSGVTKHPLINWRDLRIDFGTGGGVYAVPEIIADHASGADLIALRSSGRGVGWSTRGVGSAHPITPEEIEMYDLDPEQDDDVVVVDEGYELVAIDAVDNPSVQDAYLAGLIPSNSPVTSARDEVGRLNENLQSPSGPTAEQIANEYRLPRSPKPARAGWWA